MSFVNASFFVPPTSDLPALTPGALTINSVTRSVRTVDADTQIEFSITTSNKVVSGHSVIFKIPRPLFEVSSASGCTGSCSFTNDHIQIIATNLICSSGFPCAAGSTATFRANVRNSYNIASQVGPFTIQTTT